MVHDSAAVDRHVMVNYVGLLDFNLLVPYWFKVGSYQKFWELSHMQYAKDKFMQNSENTENWNFDVT